MEIQLIETRDDEAELTQLQEITTADQIIDILGDVIILDRYKTNFDYLYNRVVDVAALCWDNLNADKTDKLQHTLIKFKVSIADPETRVLMLNRFMISLVFIKTILPYINYVDIDDFILHDFLSEKGRGNIQNKIVKTLTSYGNTIDQIKEIIADMSYNLKMLLVVFSEADVQLFTAENLFLDHYRDSQIVRDINNVEYTSDMQTSEIVANNKKNYAILEKEMISRNNPFFLDNKYTSIIKPKQMEELYINFSQIPDGKNIIPVIMNGNGFRAGYHGIDVLYAGAIASRVPDIMNKAYMGSAGYFNRNLMILTYGTLSKTVYDCGSANPIPMVIDDICLDMMDGRYYYETKGSQVLHIFHKTDTHLLGKKLWFRSPCTCNLKEDVCHVCYGTKALKVSQLEGGFIYTTEIMTSKVSQNILSAKHLLRADAEKVEYSEAFDTYFVVESSTIMPNDEEKNFNIYIPDDYQDNISESLTIYIGKDMTPITISHYANLSINEKVIDKMKEEIIDDVTYHKITSYQIIDSCDGMFCDVTPINIMMTAKYMAIMKLFETDITKFDDISDAVMALMKLLYQTIPFLSVHGEIIIAKLIRDIDNKLLKPNFLIPDVPYQILKLQTALQNIESATTAQSFEKTKHHLLDSIFDERNEINRVGPRSFTDFMFGEEMMN